MQLMTGLAIPISGLVLAKGGTLHLAFRYRHGSSVDEHQYASPVPSSHANASTSWTCWRVCTQLCEYSQVHADKLDARLGGVDALLLVHIRLRGLLRQPELPVKCIIPSGKTSSMYGPPRSWTVATLVLVVVGYPTSVLCVLEQPTTILRTDFETAIAIVWMLRR